MNASYNEFADRLKKQGFRGDISDTLSDLDAHATDESIFAIRPDLVIYTRDVRDVQIAANTMHNIRPSNHNLHLTPRAAGSGLSGGSLNNSIVINTTRYLNTIHEHTEQDGVIYFDTDPGVYYRDLEQEMDKLGVYIPSFPASKDLCTIGGMVGNNAAGPHSFRHGHTAEFVHGLDIVLHNGERHTITALTSQEFNEVSVQENALGALYRSIWKLLQHNEILIERARPHTRKNSAGYALWDVLSHSVQDFDQGLGTFSLIPLIVGSQGTLGIITRLQMSTIAKPSTSTLLAIPVFDLNTVDKTINSLITDEPLSIELFDGPSYKAALENQSFFKKRIPQKQYKATIAQLDRIYRKRFAKKIPHFVLLAEYTDQLVTAQKRLADLHANNAHTAWIASDPHEQEMLWQVRRASYSLSQFAEPSKRPAAFLEDMIVPPSKLGQFFQSVKTLFIEHDIQAFVHGHGGDGHLHFYPLLDFTDPNTAARIPHMAEDFFEIARSFGGTICGEHNDGIIRTPYLHTMFSPEAIALFEEVEQAFDPQHIFNPGKKVHPRFEIPQVVRHTNK